MPFLRTPIKRIVFLLGPLLLGCWLAFPDGTGLPSLFAQPPKKEPAPKQPPAKKADDDSGPVIKKYDEMIEELPTVKQLLNEPPVDWVVLDNNDVYVVLPVTPRPKTLEKIQKRIDDAKKLPRPRTQKEREERFEMLKKLPFLYVTLKDGGSKPLRRIHYKNIKAVIHHEDILLLRIKKLQDEGDFPLAFELLFNLKRRKPSWPGLAAVENRQLLAEAENDVKEKQLLTALVRLEELHARDPKFKDEDLTDLQELFGQVVDDLVKPAVQTEDFRRARHYIGRLAAREPKHPVYLRWEKTLQERAEKVLADAQAASQAGRHDDAVDLVVQAVDIWPNTPRLQSAFTTLTRRFQQVRVGVKRFAGEATPFFLPTLADERIRYLTETRLFEPRAVEETVHYQTRYFLDWTPTDLGRRTVFQLQTRRPPWLPQKLATAPVIARNLRNRLDPESPEYDERLTSYIRSIRVDSPTRLQIRFSRVPPRLESVLRFPLVETDRRGGRSNEVSIRSGKPPLGENGSVPLLSRRFRPHAPETWTDRLQVFRRSRPEPGRSANYHVAEIEEVKFDSDEKAVQALKRGRIHMLAHVAPHHRTQLARDQGRIEVREYALPVNHMLQFNPDSVPTHSHELRRAMLYALNRPDMLRGLVLKTQDGGDANLGRVATAPFSSRSYAYNPLVKPRRYDITLALALTLTVRKQYQRANEAAVGAGLASLVASKGTKQGWIPKLKMLVTPGTVPRRVAEACIEQWGRIGIPVEIIEAGKLQQGRQPEWDILYRTAKMVDPVVELWPFLTMENRARVAALKQMPDWLRQELIRVDLARDWPTAVGLLHQVHEHLAAEIHLIPLFEVSDFLAYRKQDLTAYPSEALNPIHTYQDIERWEIQLTYPPNFP